MHKLYLNREAIAPFIAFFFSILVSLGQAPTINSFAPTSGPVGTNVVITGTNFSTTAANNVVYFGAVKGIVSSSTPTSISVLVPNGATFQPITVTKGGLTAYSLTPFVTTFTSSGEVLNSSSFSTKVDYPVDYNPTFTTIQDINGDGKPEFISSNAGASDFSYCKNTSTVSATSFAACLNVATGQNPFGVAFGDLDGDGQQDAAVTNGASNSVSVFLNTSNVSTISFNSKIDFPTGTYPRSVAINDIDKDGKPDLVIANYDFGLSGSVSILRNTSSIGSISFASKIDFVTGSSAVTAAVGDLNLDGKPDLVVSDIVDNRISVLQNSSTPGSVSFLAKTDYPSGSNPWGIAIGDLDLDGFPDVAVANQYSARVSVFRNITVGGAITLGDKLNIDTGEEPINVTIGNLDGDERPDLVTSNYFDNTVSLLKNISSVGMIKIDSKIDFQAGESPINVSIGDFNFNGKPDLAIGNYLSSDVSVLSNQIDLPIITAFTPTAAVVGSVISITGHSFVDVTAVRFGGIDAESFTVDSPEHITAVLGAGATGAVTVVTPYGTATLTGFKVYGIPTITSFSPASGPVGTIVTITGTNFSATASSNTVYFGATKATVNTATTTTLTVVVPFGATYQPISETVNGLTAISQRPFMVTFPGAGAAFTSTSFSPKVDFTTGMLSFPQNLAIADINVDGKSDLISINSSTSVVSVFRNTSLAAGSVAFATRSEFTVGANPNNLAVADLDGDGKQDVATVNVGESSISILKNTSSGSFITFNPNDDYSTEDSSSAIAIGDLDGDARPEVVTVSPLSGSYSVFVNTSLPGTISFFDRADFLASFDKPNSVTLCDVDGDKKLDLVISYYGTSSISIFRNISTIGDLVFLPPVILTVGIDPVNIVTGDLDGDNKPEIVVANSNSASISILRNTSTPGSVSFVPKVDYAVGTDLNAGILVSGVMISDLDGDGKADIVAENNADDSVMVFKNQCTLGTISFQKRFGYNSALGPSGLAIGDVDNDGKPDIETSNVASNLSVLKNGYLNPNITSFTPISSGSGATITITGTNFTGASSVTFGGTPAASFTVVSSTTITAVVALGSSGSVAVTTGNGTGSRGGYTFISPPTITSITPANAGAGVTVTILGTNFTGATSVTFGGVAATSFSVSSSTFMTAVVGSGASGDVEVTTVGGSGSISGFVWYPLPTVTSFSPMSAGNGDTVTIIGTHFLGTTAVKFGTRAAVSFNIISETEIRAVVGTGLSGTVAVTTPGGTGALAGFVWVAAPAITSFTPTSSGNGLTVSLTGTNFTNATAVSFGGTPALSYTVVSATSITAVVGAGTSGSVSVTTVGGTGTRTGFTWVPAPTITSFTPTSAGPGMTVTITGTNFTGATLASFGGVAGTTLAVVNSTTITVKVGVTGGSGNVAVTTAGGTGTISGFTWVPTPTIASFTPTTTGPGTSVTITGTNLTGATSVAFGGTAAASFTVDSPTSITAVVAAGTSGTVTVITPGGTATKTGFLLSSLTSFTPVNAGPGMTVTLTGVNFTGSTGVSFGGTAAASFTVVSSTSITAVVAAGSSGSVSVTSSTGGSASKTGFTWYPNPVISSFTPTNAGNGITVTITGTNFLGATAVKFGGTNASSFVVVDATTITAVVGASASGNVAVTTPGGTGTLAGFVWVAAPAITSFTPTSSGSGLTVTLTGTNFTNASAVRFGGTPALSYTVVSATSITAVVGAGTSGSVSVTTPGGTGTRTGFTWVPAPTITSFTPTSGVTTTTITITGTNFVSPATVSFGGVAGTSVTVVNSTTIRANVGAGGASGNVVVNTPGGSATQGGFTWYPTLVPTMTSFSPMTAGAGATVIITGTNFIGATIVRFGLVNATSYTIDSPTQITAIIAPGGANGNAAVITPGGTAFLPGWVFIHPPTITSFTPTSSGNGLTVTLTGTNFTNASAVSFGGTTATSFTVVSATTITAVVSSGSSGIVSVTTPGGTGTKTGFTWVPAPVITSFTPTTAIVGSTVTITGSDFTGATAVKFGGTNAASFTVDSPTSITAVVASGTSGNVTVTTAGGTGSLAGFTFIPPPTITSFTPTTAGSGTTITITGTNFGGATDVTFGGTAPISFSVVNATTITAILGTGSTGDVVVTTPGGVATMAGFTHNGMRPGHEGEDPLESWVYPNPFTNRFTLLFEAKEEGLPVELKISNLTGRIVQLQSSKTVLGTNSIEVDIEREPTGMLLLQLQRGSQTHRLQVIKK